MGFDNYCRAVLGGASHVVRCSMEHWPGMTYDDIFGNQCRWFTSEVEAEATCELLCKEPKAVFDEQPRLLRYWVEQVNLKDLGGR
jgi:hypothetical protein